MSDPSEPIARNRDIAYETQDWAVRPVVWALLGVSLLVIVALGALRMIFVKASSDASRALTVPMAAPRLQVSPQVDIAQLRTREDHDLNTYYWVDRDKGLVHIPIDAAMKKVVAQGLDGFPSAPK
ncbi:MAG: hypothetical protein JO001_07165 [Alphaproteobacteria bacterium]|nr:hypothetical protein [Alphaproteobacteria bacterium]